LAVEVWGKQKIAAMKLNGLLAVNRGSQEEPRFIKIHYRPSGKPRKRVALIGKGITSDSEACRPPSKSMETIADSDGGAAVIATMSCLPKLGLDLEVTGYVPTTDNSPGHNAQKQATGSLFEQRPSALNTDAEGR
jgi:leucyl aminopeptidase